MTEPARARKPFTVTIRFQSSPADQEELMELVTTMIMETGPFLASQSGFLGFRCHRSLDGSAVMNYLQWESLEDHERCMGSPEMEAAGWALMEWVESGRATLSTEVYEMVSSILSPS